MHRYSRAELDEAAIADLVADARQAEEQAVSGPFFPDRGITAESLRAYAAKCRTLIEKHKDGGAHAAVVS